MREDVVLQGEEVKGRIYFGVCVLDEMLNKGWLVTDDHLLSKPEQDYFSYYLDNMKFTNGMAYRNNYAHGSTPPVDDENAHISAYYAFLKLLAMLVLKIEDDLWLARKAMAVYVINGISKSKYSKLRDFIHIFIAVH